MNRRQYRALVGMARDRKGRAAARDAFLFYFLGRTGARAGEALAVKVRDVVLDASPPFVRVTTSKQKRKAHTWRDVYLDTRAARKVGRWMRVGLPRCLGRAPTPDDPLVPGAFGTYDPGPMSRRNASRIFNLYARRARLPEGLTLHSLRHYRGTMLYDVTKDLQFTRDQLGHANITSTQVYLHTSPERVGAMLDDLEEELDG